MRPSTNSFGAFASTPMRSDASLIVAIEVERHHDRRRILLVDAVDRVEHHRAVFDGPADRADAVLRPGEHHAAVAAHAAERRAQRAQAASRDGETIEPDVSVPMPNATQPAAVAEDGPRRRAARTASDIPRIVRLSAEPLIALREEPGRELRDQHGASIAQPDDDFRVLIDDAILEVRRTPGRPHALGREQILHAVRNAVQRPAVVSGGDFRVGSPRPRPAPASP